LDPATDRLESLKISRTFAVLILMAGVFSLVTGIGLLIFPLLKLQAEHLVSNLPNYIAIMQEWMYPLLGVVGEPEKIQGILNRELLKVGELPLKVMSSITSILWNSVAGLFSFILVLANLVIIPVDMFYLSDHNLEANKT
jgi:predicted PurR-regulated permease PerM